MKFLTLTALLAALAACSSTSGTPPVLPPDSASINGSGDYEVVQNGTTFTLQTGSGASANGISADLLKVGATGSSTAIGFSNTDVTLAGGQADGTYFTGLSGTPTTGLASTGVLNLTGLYGVNNSGNIRWGAINISADLTAGTLTGSTAALSIGGTINGASVSGSVVHHGTDGRFEGGFYGAAAGPTLAATFSGIDLGGIFVAN